MWEGAGTLSLERFSKREDGNSVLETLAVTTVEDVWNSCGMTMCGSACASLRASTSADGRPRERAPCAGHRNLALLLLEQAALLPECSCWLLLPSWALESPCLRSGPAVCSGPQVSAAQQPAGREDVSESFEVGVGSRVRSLLF